MFPSGILHFHLITFLRAKSILTLKLKASISFQFFQISSQFFQLQSSKFSHAEAKRKQKVAETE